MNNRILRIILVLLLLAIMPRAVATVYTVVTNTGTFAVSVTIDTTETDFPISLLIFGSTDTNIYSDLGIARFSIWTTNGQANIPFYGRTMWNAQTNLVTSVTTNKAYWNENRLYATGISWTDGYNPTNWVKAAVDAVSKKTPICWQTSLVHTGAPRIIYAQPGMYKQGAIVSLSSSDNSALSVYTTVTGKCVTVASSLASPAALTNLPVGLYFVENSNDRMEFLVQPADYSPATWFGLEGPFGSQNNGLLTTTWTNMNPHFVRGLGSFPWSMLQTNGTPSGEDTTTWAWGFPEWYPYPSGSVERVNWPANGITNAGSTRVLIIHLEQAPVYYQTNSLAIFMAGWTNYVGAIMNHFKPLADEGRLWLEVLNEPFYGHQPSAMPFNWNGCADMDWNNPPCHQAFTNWMQLMTDLVKTTTAVKVAIGSKAKIYGISTSNPNYGDVFKYMADHGATNGPDWMGFSIHDGGGLNFEDFTVLPGGGVSYDSITALQDAIGTTTPILVDETEYLIRSALLDTPYAKGFIRWGPGGDYNSSGVDWYDGSQHLAKRGLLWLAHNAQMWIHHVIYAYPDDDGIGRYGGLEGTILQIYGWERGRGPKPGLANTLQLAHLTKGLIPVSNVVTNDQVILTFDVGHPSPGVTVRRVFTWMATSKTKTVNLPWLRDLYGNSISPTFLTDSVGWYEVTNAFARGGLIGKLPTVRVNPLTAANPSW